MTFRVDRQRDRMITADRQRRNASRMNRSEGGGDFRERPLQLEGPFDPGIAQISDADEVEWRYASRLINFSDERRLIADLAWAVAGARSVGCATAMPSGPSVAMAQRYGQRPRGNSDS
jgi:hypothetical protein